MFIQMIFIIWYGEDFKHWAAAINQETIQEHAQAQEKHFLGWKNFFVP